VNAASERQRRRDLERAVDEAAKRSVINANYREFRDEAVKLSTNPFHDVGAKRILLREYFSKRGGTMNMTPHQIGKKFKRMLDHAKERAAKMQTR